MQGSRVMTLAVLLTEGVLKCRKEKDELKKKPFYYILCKIPFGTTCANLQVIALLQLCMPGKFTVMWQF